MKKRWFAVLAALGLLALLAVPAGVLAHSEEATGGYYPAYHGIWDISAQDRVAELLGITRTELLTALEGGATLGQVAEARGVPTDSLVATILAPQKEMLDIQVKYGRLTAEQAQQVLEAHTQMAEALVQATFSATPTWGQGYGGHCPMMGGYLGDPAATPGFNTRGLGMGGGMMGGGYLGAPATPGFTRGWGMGGGMMGGGMMGGWDW